MFTKQIENPDELQMKFPFNDEEEANEELPEKEMCKAEEPYVFWVPLDCR